MPIENLTLDEFKKTRSHSFSIYDGDITAKNNQPQGEYKDLRSRFHNMLMSPLSKDHIKPAA